MEEIKNVKDKLRNEPKMVRIYEQYQEYEKMLEIYQRMQIFSNKDNYKPFRQIGRWMEQRGFNRETDYDKLINFVKMIDQKKERSPHLKLNDLTSKQGRRTIAELISKIHKDNKIKEKDLNIVALAKCYGLYDTMNEMQGKATSDVIKTLFKNQVPINIYQMANRKLDSYKRNNRQELYDSCRTEKSDSIIHMAAAALEIGPGEVENDLKVLGIVKGKVSEIVIDDYVKFEELEVHRGVLDQIIMNDKLTDEQKSDLISQEYNKVTEINNFNKQTIEQWMNTGKSIKNLPKTFIERHGVTFIEDEEREIS